MGCNPREETHTAAHERKPSWVKVRLPNGRAFQEVRRMVEGKSLFTVCEEALCPNRYECWSHGTATFMVCGDICTRACGFCAVKTARPRPLDPGEPERVADAVARMKLRHAVITMTTRDDLPDGASGHIAATVRAIRRASPRTIIEVLVSDMKGEEASIRTIMAAHPHIFNHNLETVERLSPLVRFRAKYRLSLKVLQMALEIAHGKVATKSGIMLGLGETREEVLRTMDDLLIHGVTVLTMGQYLRPSAKHLPVIDYIRPGQFDEYRAIALAKGFRHVAAGPLIRSSHHDANFAPEADVLDAINEELRASGELPAMDDGA